MPKFGTQLDNRKTDTINVNNHEKFDHHPFHDGPDDGPDAVRRRH